MSTVHMSTTVWSFPKCKQLSMQCGCASLMKDTTVTSNTRERATAESHARGLAIARHAAESGTASTPCAPCVARSRAAALLQRRRAACARRTVAYGCLAMPLPGWHRACSCLGDVHRACLIRLRSMRCLVVESGKVVEVEARASRLAPEASGHLLPACTMQEL